MRHNRGTWGLRVMLVEDEPRLREMLIQGTREMGYEPVGAASAEQAVRLFDFEPAPVVVVDLSLPGAGGLELLQTLRKRWPETQAIIVTGFGDLQAARQAIHLDVVDFLTKPAALGDLEIALGRAFERIRRNNPSSFDPQVDTSEQEQEIEPPSAPHLPAFAPRETSAALSMEELERMAILAALKKHGNNRTATAAELGISLRKLYYRIGEYQKKGLLP